MDTNLSMVPPPTCHQNIPHQPLNIEGFGVGISWVFGLVFFLLVVVVVWFSYIRSIARGVRKQQHGEKKNPPRQVLHGTSRYRVGCPACQEFWQCHPAWKTSVSLVRLAPKLAGMTVPIHCSKPDISAGSASRQPSPPASFWLHLPCYFETKRLKKHERNGADCPRYVLDAFCPYKNVSDVL